MSLQSGTRIQLLDPWNGKVISLLKGSISAEVAKQPQGQPLRILSPSGDVEVLGTAFVFTADEGGSLSVPKSCITVRYGYRRDW